jgi:hypothetical protein
MAHQNEASRKMLKSRLLNLASFLLKRTKDVGAAERTDTRTDAVVVWAHASQSI